MLFLVLAFTLTALYAQEPTESLLDKLQTALTALPESSENPETNREQEETRKIERQELEIETLTQDQEKVFSSLTPGFSVLLDATYANNKPQTPEYLSVQNQLRCRYISPALYYPFSDFYLYSIANYNPNLPQFNQWGFEETYGVYNLPEGFQLKAGKFFSSFGRDNEKHLHSLAFTNKPLIYQKCFGEESLGSTGYQLSYLAPTPFYLLAGYENYQGNIEESGFTSQRKVQTGFLKYSADFKDNTLLLGTSRAGGWDETGSPVKVQGFDLTFQHWPSGQKSYKKITFQGEYLKKTTFTDTTSGYYLEAGYKYNRVNTLTYRFDAVKSPLGMETEEAEEAGEGVSYANQVIHSLAWEYGANEFRKFRLIGSYDQTTQRIYPVVQFMQIFQIGTHPAHSF